MAPWVTHLVIGERVFAALWPDEMPSAVYGGFLLGCVLVDVNTFSALDRRQTHFVGRLEEDGEDAFRRSCDCFAEQLPALLVRPWVQMAVDEQAFVAGYLCHLAADEIWKRLGWRLMAKFDIQTLADLPVSGEVALTVFDVLSSEHLVDFPRMARALAEARVPDVLQHVLQRDMQRMWGIVEEHLLDKGSSESYFAMLGRSGQSEANVAASRVRHEQHWVGAEALIEGVGGVAPYIQEAVAHSIEVVPRLWGGMTDGQFAHH